MRIVNREQFMKLPENTLFAKYHPSVFGQLAIKGESWERDFLVQEIVDAIECKDTGEYCEKVDGAQHNGDSIRFDFNCQGRDGYFDDDQLFAVWEQEDVRQLIERLKKCLME